jgi:hypothetical protein
MKALDAYRTLGVSDDAEPATARAAYHRLLKLYHPDLAGHAANRVRLEQVVEAYRSILEQRSRIVAFPHTGIRRRAPVRSAEVTQSELATLGYLVAHGRSAAMRAFSVRRLGNSQKRSAYVFLRPALYDSDRLVVQSAIRAIGELKVAQCAGEIASLFHRTDGETRHLILDMVEQAVGTVRFSDVILVGMRDTDPAIRKRSLSLYARSLSREEVG